MGCRVMEKTRLNLDSIIRKVWQESSYLFDGNAFLKETVWEVLREVGYDFSFSPAPVERVRDFLGINIHYRKKLLTDAEYYSTAGGENINITAEQVTYKQYEEGEFTKRGRFSLAHELGHFLLGYIFERFLEIDEKYKFSKENPEKLCNFIASEFLLPSYLFQKISLGELYQKITSSVKAKSSETVFQEKSFLLHIDALELLRRCFNVSRFVLVRQLHNTQILNEAECGAIISFFNVNRNTGRSPALRVYATATPVWGFMPQNIRLSSIGLTSAVHAFNSFGYGTVGKWREQITVNEKSKCQSKEKWRSRIGIESEGEHALYQFAGQQSYVLTTLKWSNPEKR